jgi:peroxiredoxin
LSRFYQENSSRGWQVFGLAVDRLDPVKRFLERSPVTFPVAMADMHGVEIGRSLGNLSGGLPFTVVLGSDGRVVQRKMGKVTPDDLLAWALMK